MVRVASSFAAFLLLVTLAQARVPNDSRLHEVIGKKSIRIAYRADTMPFSFLNDSREPAGYSVDLCRLAVKSIEQQFFVPELEIVWVPVVVQTRLSAVANGQADMECGANTVTLSRMNEVDFPVVNFVKSSGLIVSRTSNFRSFADISGKRIAVVPHTTNEHVPADQGRPRKRDTIPVAVNIRDKGVAVLKSGSVDGYASDKRLLIGA